MPRPSTAIARDRKIGIWLLSATDPLDLCAANAFAVPALGEAASQLLR
jgi:hypothetical protein